MKLRPNMSNPGRFCQLLILDESPPIHTQTECEVVGLSRIKSWCWPGGEVSALEGAVILHVIKPIKFPCVLEIAEAQFQLTC